MLWKTLADEHGIAVKYLGRSGLLLKGPVSGRIYALRPDVPRVIVDPRDSAPFLASPLFDNWLEK
jgi:hypothetical protein